jgi:hypothetical protein
VDINGKEDPLRKTLLVIDEAHKLFNAADLSAIERPDVPTLVNMLRNSYEVSKGEAVKLLLMTGTPITNTPMDFVRMVNLFKTEKDALPEDFEDFAEEYLDSAGKFTKKGGVEFMNSIAGSISHLDRSKDARQFAQPIIKHIHSQINKRASGIESKEALDTKYKTLIANEKRAIAKVESEVKGHMEISKKLTAQIKDLKEQRKGVAKADKPAFKNEIDELEEEKRGLKPVIKDAKTALKAVKGNIKIVNGKKRVDRKVLKEDVSQESLIVQCIQKKVEPKKVK